MSNTTKVYGTNATTLLGVAFVVLKLTGIINWSWWWVTFPFWIPWALFFFFICLAVIVNIFQK